MKTASFNAWQIIDNGRQFENKISTQAKKVAKLDRDWNGAASEVIISLERRVWSGLNV